MPAIAQERVRTYRRLNRRNAEFPLSTRAVLKLIKTFRLPVTTMQSTLEAKVVRANGDVEDLGVISRRVITTAGVNFIVACHQNTAELEAMNFHAMGTGAVAEAIGDTALGAEVETRSTGTQSAPAGNQYRTIATVTATAARVITEHGIFSIITTSSGTLFDRSVFAAVNLAIGDSIQFTYTVTYTAGG